MSHPIPTVCRICESACGLLADVEEDRVVGLRPDPDHPVSQGYACVKGTRFHRVHHAAHRVPRPTVRPTRDAEWHEPGWDAALGGLGAQLRAVHDRHGPGAVGVYAGNAAGASLGAVLGISVLQRAFQTSKHYAALTLDNAGMFVVLESCLGNAMHTFCADYAASDDIVLIGTDPLASQPSQAQSHPGGVGELLDAGRRGVLTVLDPRRSATAKRARLHLRPRAGSDVEVLAAWVGLACAAALRGGVPTGLVRSDVEALSAAVDGFSLSRAAAASGLDAQDLASVFEGLRRAERPLVWSGLGVLLGPHGTVGYWLTLCLQALLGGLDRPGGWVRHAGAVDVPGLFQRLGVKGADPDVRSVDGRYPATLGTLPSATLADDVLSDRPDRLRALVVVGGNPAVSLPDTGRAHQALAQLELLVVVDLFHNQTARFAHAVLPACSWLAREDVQVHLAQQRRVPHLQRSPAVVPPVGEARDDWRILSGLVQAAGLPLLGPGLGPRIAGAALGRLGPGGVARVAVAAAGAVRWRDVLASPRGVMAAPRAASLTVHLAVPKFVEALSAVEAPGPGLRLVTSVRPVGTMNSWLGSRSPVAHVHPDDLDDRRGRHVLRATDGTASLEVEVLADPEVGPGVVVLPFGQDQANPNVLIDTSKLDALTGQPVSNGRRVTLTWVP